LIKIDTIFFLLNEYPIFKRNFDFQYYGCRLIYQKVERSLDRELPLNKLAPQNIEEK
jgi:hypothetical protein